MQIRPSLKRWWLSAAFVPMSVGIFTYHQVSRKQKTVAIVRLLQIPNDYFLRNLQQKTTPFNLLPNPSESTNSQILKLSLQIISCRHTLNSRMVCPTNSRTTLRTGRSLHRHATLTNSERMPISAVTAGNFGVSTTSSRRVSRGTGQNEKEEVCLGR